MMKFALELICVPAQYRETAANKRCGRVLTGMVLSAILAGCFGVALSMLTGLSPILSLVLYSLSGCCGVLGFVLRALATEDQPN